MRDRESRVFFFNDTATTEIYTLSLHDALPIWKGNLVQRSVSPPHGKVVHARLAACEPDVVPDEGKIGRAHV